MNRFRGPQAPDRVLAVVVGVLVGVYCVLVASAAGAQPNEAPPPQSAEQRSTEPARPVETARQPSTALTQPRSPTGPASSPAAPPGPSTASDIAAQPINPWFVRPQFVLTAGADSAWKLGIYGFAEADGIWDSTESFNDGLNNNVIAHPLTQASRNPRFQMTIRNSRLGFRAQAPESHRVRASGVLEFDLFGNQPKIDPGGGAPGVPSGPGATTESAYFNNAGLRVRHAYVRIEAPIVNVLAGQTYYLLGWQSYFFGATCGFLGMPNQLFNRTAQLRLSHTFASNSVSLDIAGGAFRPVQRDSGVPDTQGGARLSFNRWKGITTPGSGGTDAQAAAIAVSGLVRSFKVDPHAPLPAPRIPLLGWAVAANVLLPIIPARDGTDRGNALTLTGEFVTGTGHADQYTGMTAGATMPNVYPLPPGTPIMSNGTASPQDMAGAAPQVGLPYTANVDPGLVAFDQYEILHTINWQTFVVGLQYYLPPTGRVFVSGNYSQAHSNNIASLYHPDTPRQPWINPLGVFQTARYVDGNIFFDITPSVRAGFSYQWVQQTLTDDTTVHNHRVEMTFLYFL
ncbi:MAG: hypothetical protein ABJA82_02355 [Myxococcales bacterium]